MFGVLRKWFGKETLLEPISLGVIGTDMHSHLIPGIDDGAPTMEASLELIMGLQSLGYQNLITTPHIMSDYYPNTPEIIMEGLQKVREAIKELGLHVKIHAAAEYMVDNYFEKLVDTEAELLTIYDRDILVELPFAGMPPNFYKVAFKLQAAGYQVVLAHPERYAYMHDDLETYHELMDRNIKLQVNLNSFTGAYGPQVQHAAEQLVENDMVRALGSDCHHLGHIEVAQEAVKKPVLHKLLTQKNLLNHEWQQAFGKGLIG